MANYSIYIPTTGSTTYPTQISNFITVSEAIDTEVEDARGAAANLLDNINLKLALTGGNLSGALIISTGDLTLSAGNIVVTGTVDGRDIATDGLQLDTNTGQISTNTTKLSGIEVGADVTDTANVTAAGALMDTEVDADLKTLSLPASTTISAFGATVIDDADAATARTTLGTAASGANTDITSLASPAISAATATTQAASDNTTKVATTAYADAAAVAVAGIPVVKDWGSLAVNTAITLADAELHIIEITSNITLTFSSTETSAKNTIAIHNTNSSTITLVGIDNNSPTLTIGTNVQDILGLIKSHGKITAVGLMDNVGAL